MWFLLITCYGMLTSSESCTMIETLNGSSSITVMHDSPTPAIISILNNHLNTCRINLIYEYAVINDVAPVFDFAVESKTPILSYVYDPEEEHLPKMTMRDIYVLSMGFTEDVTELPKVGKQCEAILVMMNDSRMLDGLAYSFKQIGINADRLYRSSVMFWSRHDPPTGSLLQHKEAFRIRFKLAVVNIRAKKATIWGIQTMCWYCDGGKPKVYLLDMFRN